MTRLRRTIRLVAVGWLVFLLEPLSSAGLGFPSFVVLFGVTVCLGGIALTLARQPGEVRWPGLVAWLAYPLAAGSLLLLFLGSQSPANPLFRLRFHLSRPSLDGLARAALARTPTQTPGWVGLFPVRRVSVFPPEVRLVSEMCGVVDECGFLYLPEPASSRRPKTRLGHLGGPWYHLYAVF